MISPKVIDTLHVRTLDAWEVASCEPAAVTAPEDEGFGALEWSSYSGIGTVAGALQQAGRFTDDPQTNLDASDWWFRTTFRGDVHPVPDTLHFGGLATVAQVWLNGVSILESENMFLEHRVPVTVQDGENSLIIRCASVDAWLKQRRPRGKWRTRIVQQQQLRWLRTSLLGRVKAWMPPAAPVGPWRPVEVLAGVGSSIVDVDVRASVHGNEGRVAVRVDLDGDVHGARLVVGDHRATLGVRKRDGLNQAFGELAIPSPELWWPHSHGAPYRYLTVVELDVDGHTTRIDLPDVGFRTIVAATDDDDFQLQVNGEPIFCRGACLTHLDVVGLAEDEDTARVVLQAMRDAGMNMVRVVGTATYESDMFYSVCDELGLLVWQDFPFANMDYPGQDDAFLANVEGEVRQNLQRLKRHPSLAVLCGGSEVFQQAAMLGLEPDAWQNPIFHELLPELIRQTGCSALYVEGSPDGGSLPFHVGKGVAHYFGVGAYRRPLIDARTSQVRFVAEGLGFANVPEPETVERLAGGGLVHLPEWKRGVPRDAGVGWDFEDVRDHYLQELFGEEPASLRYADPDRYLQLSRVTSGEVMARAFAEWRRAGSECSGGLVWTLRDLRPGAGWGIIDSYNVPKSPYWFLKRLFMPVSVVLTDHGLDGFRAHVVNEMHVSEALSLELALYREDGIHTAAGTVQIEVPPGSTAVVEMDAVLGRFADAGWAYQFGPRSHDAVVATLREGDGGAVVSQAFHFLSPCARAVPAVELEARAVRDGDNVIVTVSSSGLARAVQVDAPGWQPSDNYFSVVPEAPVTFTASPRKPQERFRMNLSALNGIHPLLVQLED